MCCQTAAVLLFINDGFQQQLQQIIFLLQIWKHTWLVQNEPSWHTVSNKTFPYRKLIPASNLAKFVWACEPCEMASVTETLSSSLWECKSKSWEMKARLGTQRTLRPHRGRINTAWFKSNGPRPARSQARIRDTGLISPRSSTHDTSAYFKTLQQYSKSSQDTLLFFIKEIKKRCIFGLMLERIQQSDVAALNKKIKWLVLGPGRHAANCKSSHHWVWKWNRSSHSAHSPCACSHSYGHRQGNLYVHTGPWDER